MKKQDYYGILGITFDATQEEIKQAYRNKAKRYHPDINPDFDATEKMQQVNAAYETLSNIISRKEYDIDLQRQNIKINVSENKTAYNSYTKTRDESEQDLEPWLKDYLKKRRKLNELYEKYATQKGNIITLARAFINPSLNDLKNVKELEITIGVELQKMSDVKPVNALNYLFDQLINVTNSIGFRQRYNINPDDKMLLLSQLFVKEIGLVLAKCYKIKDDSYIETMNFILKKYAKISEVNCLAKNCNFLPDPYYEFMEK